MQLTKCRRYGHPENLLLQTTQMCKMLKCGDEPKTANCTKSQDTPVKCALWAEDHPSNYKGCKIYQEIEEFN